MVRRQLGNRLRRLREDAGQTINSVASAKIFSTSKMIRIENGRIEVKAGDVWTLCRFYGVTDSAVIDSLAVLADGTGERGWWEDYGGRDRIPDWFALYLGLEEGADEVLLWHPELIPGLLQTPDYAEAVLRTMGTDDVDHAVQLRLARQQRFFQRKTPLRVVLSPATLLREVAGAEATEQQRHHLLELSSSGQVELRLPPWSVGAHTAMTGGFTIFGFDGDDHPSTVWIEFLLGGRYLETERELTGYRRTFDTLWQVSVPIEEQYA